MAIASLKDSTMMYFSCDVGKFLNSDRGLLDVKNYDYESLMGTTFGMDKKQRIQSFASGSSHAMTLMAVDLDKNGKPTKWMVENSWGAGAGYQGHLIMTDEWFNEYMFRLVVETKYAPKKALEVLKQKPIRLPAWDPMFAEEKDTFSLLLSFPFRTKDKRLRARTRKELRIFFRNSFLFSSRITFLFITFAANL